MSDEVGNNLNKLLQRLPEAAERALAQAGFSLMRDAIMDQPAVPLDEGTLRGSGSVFVGNVLKHTSAEMGMPGGTPATTHQGSRQAGEFQAIVGFNTPYAARLHEHPEYEFQHSGTGGKYLEAKLNQHRDDYVAEINEELKEALYGA